MSDFWCRQPREKLPSSLFCTGTWRRLLGDLLCLLAVFAGSAWGQVVSGPVGEDSRSPVASVDSEQRARLLWEQARHLCVQQEYERGIALFEEAVEMYRRLHTAPKSVQRNLDLARCLRDLGMAHARSARFGRDSAREPSATPVAPPLGRAPYIDAYVATRNAFDEAVAIFRRAYPNHQFPEGHEELADALGEMGRVLRDQGQTLSAVRYLRDEFEIRQRLFPEHSHPEQLPELAARLHDLGSLALRQRNLAQAHADYEGALAMYRRAYPKDRYPEGHPHLALCLKNLGLTSARQGDLAAARRCVEEAVDIFRAFDSEPEPAAGHRALADGLGLLGQVLFKQEEYEAAAQHLEKAFQMKSDLFADRETAKEQTHLRAMLGDLVTALALDGKLHQAVKFLEDLALEWDFDLSAEMTRFGMALLARNQAAPAAEVLSNAARHQYAGALSRFSTECSADASNYLSSNPHLDGALIAAWQDTGRDIDALYRLIWERRNLVQRLETHRRIAWKASDAPGLPAGYACYLEIRKELGGWALAPSEPSPERDGQTAVRIRQLAEKKEHWERRLMQYVSGFGRSFEAQTPSMDALRECLPGEVVFVDLLVCWAPEQDSLQQAAEEPRGRPRVTYQGLVEVISGNIQVRSGNRGPGGEKACESTSGVTVARDGPGDRTAVAMELQPSGAAMDRRGRYHYFAFVVAPDRPVQLVDLGPLGGAIDQTVWQWQRALAAGEETDAPRELRRLLWEPLESCWGSQTRHVYLCPAGNLSGVPWCALTGADPDSVLLEKYAIAIVPHGHFLAQRLSQGHDRIGRPESLLVIGNVDYNVAVGQAKDDSRLEQLWKPLPGTQWEMEELLAVAKARKVVKLTCHTATADRVIAALPTVQAAHFGTHGFFAGGATRDRLVASLRLDGAIFQRKMSGVDRMFIGRDGQIDVLGVSEHSIAGRNPLLLSALVLAGANRGREAPDTYSPDTGGYLSAEAIAGLSLDELSLVVLSACETGLGDRRVQEGVFSLQRAFHTAGAANVIGSLWPVDDGPTAFLMAQFYENLWGDAQMPPVEALRQAQLTLYRSPGRLREFAETRGSRWKPQPLPPNRTTSPSRLWAPFVLSGPGL